MRKSFKTWILTALATAMISGLQAQAPSPSHPTIGGAVYGGGRVADVNGSTLVKIVNCETIGAVFGGNDIAGKVLAGTANTNSFSGSEVLIGVADQSAQIRIGSVYGGGNGFYSYPGGVGGFHVKDSAGTKIRHYVRQNAAIPTGTGFFIAEYYFTGGDTTKVLDVPSGTFYVPQTVRTKITVNTNIPVIDSLFGGAKNAFVTATSDNSTLITVNGGTIYSVFGGNNFGGALGTGSNHTINIAGTKTETIRNNNPSDNLGVNHGIRYLFGGGNKVAGQNVVMNITGGQIDTCFAGGNSADVGTSVVTVNITSPLYDYAHSKYSNPNDYPYDIHKSVFDIRCLFGGNNKADMAHLPTITLTRGGIHNLYGGGNVGIMRGGIVGDDNRSVCHYIDNDNREAGTLTENRYLSTKIVIKPTVANNDYLVIDTVYGGGQSAGTLCDTYVEVAGGHVGTIFGGTNIRGSIGPNRAAAMKSNIWLHGGNIHESVFGGSNGYYRCMDNSGYLSGITNTVIPGATVPYNVSFSGSIPQIWQTSILMDSSVVVSDNVYGGGNLAFVGRPHDVFGDAGASTKVRIMGGTVGNDVYGGGNFADVYGTADVHISTNNAVTIGHNVYGGNDKTGRVTGYGRGAGSLSPYRTSTVRNANFVNSNLDGSFWDSFNGENKIELTATNAAAYVLVEGNPSIAGDVYGGGNGDYNYYRYNDGYVVERYYVGDEPSGEGTWIEDPEGKMTWESGREEVLRCSSTTFPEAVSAFVDIHIGGTGSINRVFAGGNSASVSGQTTVNFNCTDIGSSAQVGSIFGGNNKVDMAIVPRLLLQKGKVSKIYGGGNLGGMTGLRIANATNVSTYVGLVSPDVTVTDEIYGGCNAADVEHATFVKVVRGTLNGNIFGGNDVAGHVTDSYVWVNGLDATPRLTLSNMVFGGGNGEYTYTTNGDLFNANGITGVTGRPTVGNTHVTVNGNVELDNNLYGGGLAGDCTNTTVVLDAAEGIFNDLIFGGGRGDVANIGNRCPTYNGFAGGVTKSHVGNVTGTATLNIVRMHDMHEYGVSRRRAIFCGGHAGDVANTELTLANTNTAHIPALYTGCLASNVTGTAHAVLNGVSRDNEVPIVDTVYGGNDYSGKVQHTNLEINSGTYLHVFGAGNGDYDYRNDSQLAYVFTETTNTNTIDDPALRETPPTGFNIPSGYHTAYDEHASSMVINTEVQPAQTTYVHTYRYWRNVSCPGWQDTVPYSMVVDVTINGGHFIHNVYGGGNMGLVGDRDMDPAQMNNKTYAEAHIGYITLNIHGGNFDHHVFTGARGKVAMKSQFFKGTSGWTNPVTSQNGKNITGDNLYNQLAYAQKILNIDGGTVLFSIYGGSEAVDDGFPYECIGTADVVYYNPRAARPAHRYQTNSSMRPSSILNIMGGEIRKSVYGGGYQGNAYGSIYVNVGADAVDDSPVWTNTYNYVTGIGSTPAQGAGFTLAAYKPTGMTASTVGLEASVYNGSDWGEADDHAYFNTRGVFGGETNILIDGRGYNTSGVNPELNDLPGMNIAFSVIGAGTSTEGGDIRRLITIRNYGYYDECGKTTRNLMSIQRADKVILDHVYITLDGEQDAFSAYASPSYSLCRLDTLMFYDDNIVFITAPGMYIGNVTSVKPFAEYNGIRDMLDFTSISHPDYLYNNARVAGGEGENVSSNDMLDNLLAECSSNICLKLPTERGRTEQIAAANTLVIKNGSYLRVAHFKDTVNNLSGADEMDGKDDAGNHWGSVFGWMYLISDETQSYIYADYKTPSSHSGEGGFISACAGENVAITGFSSDLKEVQYTNVSENGNPVYRTWRVGTTQGSRSRHITLVANVTPDNTLNYNLRADDYTIRLSNGLDSTGADATITIPNNTNLAYATTTLELPPAEGGNFYIISSVTIDQDNGEQMKLTDVAYDHSIDAFFRPRADDDVALDIAAISRDGANDDANMRNYTFGLAFSTLGANSNFEQSSCWMPSATFIGNPDLDNVDQHDPLSFHTITTPAPHDIWQAVTTDEGGNPTTYKYFNCWPTTSISGNKWMNGVKGYISRAVKAGSGMIPTMEFTLLYDKRLTTTITRDVEFTMQEYTSTGEWVGPVNVTVTIATVIKDFDDLEAPVLAMYNEGINNEYVRKVTIPASYKQRELYITGVEWELNTEEGTAYQPAWFALQDSSTTIASNDVFSLILSPSEAASENITNHLGWYNIDTTGIDLYNLALTDFISTYKDEANLPDNYDFPGNKLANYTTEDPSNNPALTDFTRATRITQNGMLIGTLDGRSTASIELTLKYNGDYVYHDCYPKPLGKIRVKMKWRNTKHVNDAGVADDGEFYINIFLRTREAGDTIYLGPGTSIERTPDGSGATPVTVRSFHHPANVAIHGSSRVQDNHHSYVTNPDCYVNTLTEALTVYWEGDVIAVMGTIPINEAEKSVIAHGDDYSIIQIIRYSGSHYKFPSLGCAHTGPLFDVSAGNLNFRNVWLNGSGCTRTKPLVAGTHGQDEYSRTRCGTTDNYYLKNWRREEVLLYSEGPMIYCHGSGKVNLSSNVRLSNNFNGTHNKTWNSGQSRWDDNSAAVCGGAMAVIKDGSTLPSVIIGNMCTFYDNVIVDWSSPENDAATVLGHATNEPLNYGGAIYIDGGHVQLGTTIQTSENNINISRNYYLHSMSGENTGLIVKTKHMLGDVADETFQIYYLDTLKMSQSFALSNIYLSRTPYVCPSPMNSTPSNAEAVARYQHVSPVRYDEKSSTVFFIADMSENSRIGISKWFPGYIYNYNPSHRLYNHDIPRDTIIVAMDLSGKNRIAELNAERGVFFNDSIYYSMANRPDVNNIEDIPDPAPEGFSGSTLEEYKTWLLSQGTYKDWNSSTPKEDSIGFYVDRNLTTYHGNTGVNPNYSDRVFVFQHPNVSPRNIFFQRCATFGKGKRHTLVESEYYTNDPGHPTTLTYLDLVQGDSIAFKWNPDATCVASTDTILFFAGGGFFPYKYHWDYDSIVSDVTTPESWRNITLTRIPVRERTSYGPNAIAGVGSRNELLRTRAQRDTLVLRMLHQRQNQLKSTYLYTVTATDLTSNCEVVQPVMVRVGKITQEGRGSEFSHQHGAFYIDSTNFLRHRNPYAAYYNYNHPDSANTLAGIYTDFPVSDGELGVTPDAFGSLRAGEAHDDGSISYPNARLFRQKLDEHGDPLYITPEGIETTEAAGNEPLSDYLYYRVSVPGVDSNSFHDHVELYPDKNYYALYGHYPFANSDGEALYPWYDATGDTLVYLRWMDENNPPSTAADYTTRSNFTNEGNCHRVRYVPFHTYSNDDGTLVQGGIRRAGFSHVPMQYYRRARNDGNTAERMAARTFSGKPYHDAQYAINNATYVEYGTWNPVPSEKAPAADLYSSEMVPRYLRVYEAFKVNPKILPEEAQGYVEMYPMYATSTMYDDPNNPSDPNRANVLSPYTEFCANSVIHLRPIVKDHDATLHPLTSKVPGLASSSDWEYVAWDFDPSGHDTISFVVGRTQEENEPTIYVAPKDYWWQVVTHHPGEESYNRYYNGNVKITDYRGLAWLISTVNGYNGQNAHTFRFDTVYLDFYHEIGGGRYVDTVNMAAHKWTPLGNLNNPFEGTLLGITRNAAGDSIGVEPLGTDVEGFIPTVANIIVNEPTLQLVGMFGYTNCATLSNFNMETPMLNGTSYVGSLVSYADSATKISNVSVNHSIIFGEHIMGGLVAHSRKMEIDVANVNEQRLKGNAVYAGGMIGLAENTTMSNWRAVVSLNNLSAIYFGSTAGKSEASTFDPTKTVLRSSFRNGYARIISDGLSRRIGGLVGYAEALNLNNCYVYGEAKGRDYVGGLAGNISSNVNISNCYYLNGMTESLWGYNIYANSVNKSTTFQGSGNHVLLTERVDGYNNMTRALNRWVKAQNDNTLLWWRSDLDWENEGYPIFGTPDMITVRDSMSTAVCDSLLWDGLPFTESGIYMFRVVDSTDYLDSTFILYLTVNYSERTDVSDTVRLGNDYEGYGFRLTSSEIQELLSSQPRLPIQTLQRIDSLYTVNGCDSVVVLTLCILNMNDDAPEVIQQLYDVKVYPNPTRSLVNVEGDGLLSVEVYDLTSRHLMTIQAEGDKVTFDLSNYTTGSYYIRVKTAHGTVVKKVIKK
ncbi:MAG: T9SS type A sorting domain-containing protein [Bacteroidales bacterium]|nr:T9SS type A sorting domain-containing protein [Bacteroidales bacterium]